MNRRPHDRRVIREGEPAAFCDGEGLDVALWTGGLAVPLVMAAKVDRLLTHHNALRRGLGHAEVAHGAVMDELTSVADHVLPYLDRVLYDIVESPEVLLLKALAFPN
jgi:hypothetical protein